MAIQPESATAITAAASALSVALSGKGGRGVSVPAGRRGRTGGCPRTGASSISRSSGAAAAGGQSTAGSGITSRLSDSEGDATRVGIDLQSIARRGGPPSGRSSRPIRLGIGHLADLAQARTWSYPRRRAKKMKIDLGYWQSVLREAERELQAATTRTTLNAAAKKLMRAKAELKRLQVETQPNPA